MSESVLAVRELVVEGIMSVMGNAAEVELERDYKLDR